MSIFDDFMREEAPQGIIGPSPVSRFVKEHFNDIAIMRSKHYSWKQIAKAVKQIVTLPPAKLDVKLARAFSWIKIHSKKGD